MPEKIRETKWKISVTEKRISKIKRKTEKTAEEDLKDVFGLAITLVTTAKTKEEADAFFRHLGIPFKKDAE